MNRDPIPHFLRKHSSQMSSIYIVGFGFYSLVNLLLCMILANLFGPAAAFLLFVLGQIGLTAFILYTLRQAKNAAVANALDLLTKEFRTNTYSRPDRIQLKYLRGTTTKEVLGQTVEDYDYQLLDLPLSAGEELYAMLKASDNPVYQEAAVRIAQRS